MAIDKLKLLIGLKACSLGVCTGCPYNETRCTEHLCGDAYKLLMEEKQMDDIYIMPKYKVGDLAILKWPLHQDDSEDPAFKYLYVIFLAADSNNYRMLKLRPGTGAPLFDMTGDTEYVNNVEGKVLYHIDADAIRKLCCEGPQI